MKKTTFLIVLLFMLFSKYVFCQTAIIIDHNCTNLHEIPDNWIDSAKSKLHIGYGHTSHGSQLISGMNAIESYFADGKYDWSQEDGEGVLHLFEGNGTYLPLDVGYEGWDDETREYLDDHPDCNVIIWSWCGQVNDVNIDLPTHYFEPMTQLETEYPDVDFVYMTGHLEGWYPLYTDLFIANQQIRDYCIANNKILYDFADIEKYDPDKIVNYENYFANDACEYDPDGELPIDRTENWANNWKADNPDHELTAICSYCTSCDHSVDLNCVQKGIAAWWLWAKLAGWEVLTDSSTITTENIIKSDITSKIHFTDPFLYIDSEKNNNIRYSVYVYSMHGRLIQTYYRSKYSNIDLSYLQKGIYIIKLMDDNSSQTIKIIKN